MTHLRCGGKYNNNFIANFQQIVILEEFWKSISIWWSYAQNIGSLFSGHGVVWFSFRCTSKSHSKRKVIWFVWTSCKSKSKMILTSRSQSKVKWFQTYKSKSKSTMIIASQISLINLSVTNHHHMLKLSTISQKAHWHFLTFSPNSC